MSAARRGSPRPFGPGSELGDDLRCDIECATWRGARRAAASSAQSPALRCPFCGVSLTASETRYGGRNPDPPCLFSAEPARVLPDRDWGCPVRAGARVRRTFSHRQSSRTWRHGRGLPRRGSPVGAAGGAQAVDRPPGPMRRDALARFTTRSAAGALRSRIRMSAVYSTSARRKTGITCRWSTSMANPGPRCASASGACHQRRLMTSPDSCAPVLPPPTNMGSCIAISSRRTSCSMVGAASPSWTSGWPCRPAIVLIGSPALPPISLPNSWRGRSRTKTLGPVFAWPGTLRNRYRHSGAPRVFFCGRARRRSVPSGNALPPGRHQSLGSSKPSASVLRPIPAERPRSALHVAAQLPGGDAMSAALADGRVPTPDIVASTPSGSALSPVVAVSALGVVIAGLALDPIPRRYSDRRSR